MPEPPKPTIALIDGHGATAECYLYANARDMRDSKESMDWPKDWPKHVSYDFLVAHGCHVLTT